MKVRTPRLLMLALSCLWLCDGHAQVIDFTQGRWVDLTHDFDEQAVYWPTARLFKKETVFEGVTDGGFYYTAYNLSTAEHGGTHMDAPIHFFEGRQTAEQVPLERLIGSAVVIDVTAQAAENPDYALDPAAIEAWEAEHGKIQAGEIVLVRTGYARFWPFSEFYLGTAERGEDAVPMLHFPGIGTEAARLLVERSVAAVGLDTASVDRGQSTEFMTHRILFEANIPGFENVADLSSLPPRGAFVVALPMKIRGGSGAPLRITAFVPGDSADK